MTSVLRRYTPPTCTLEIAAKQSSLSRWTDRPVLKQLWFRLSFDDPKLPTDQQVTIRGDRAQLDVLCEAVETYVQQFLSTSTPTPLAVANGASLMNGSSPAWPKSQFPAAEVRQAATIGVFLKPKGLLSHELNLGVLANEESGPVVRLSALQLFDLANALDEYSKEALSLPALERGGWWQTTPNWAKVAAVLVLAVGVTAPLARFVMDVSSPTMTAGSTSEESQAFNQPAGDFPEPAPGLSLGKDPMRPEDQIPPGLPLEPLPPPPPPTGNTQAPAFPSVTVPETAPIVPGGQTALQPAPAPLPDQVAIAPPAAPTPAPQIQIQGEANADQAPAARLAPDGDAPSIAAERSAAPPEAAISAARPAPGSGAPGSIPQVGEVQSYFQQEWQPPEGLDRAIEYRLRLNPNGSIQQITPLGDAAGTFVDRTGMPLLGEPFVSPIDGGQSPLIRLVLRPDGRVQTFLESAN